MDLYFGVVLEYWQLVVAVRTGTGMVRVVRVVRGVSSVV